MHPKWSKQIMAVNFAILKRQKEYTYLTSFAQSWIYTIKPSDRGRLGITERSNEAIGMIRNDSTIIWSFTHMKIYWCKWNAIWSVQTIFQWQCSVGKLLFKSVRSLKILRYKRRRDMFCFRSGLRPSLQQNISPTASQLFFYFPSLTSLTNLHTWKLWDYGI